MYLSERERTKCIREIIKTLDKIDDWNRDNPLDLKLLDASLLADEIMLRYNIKEKKYALELIKAAKDSMPYWTLINDRKHSEYYVK